MESLYMVLITTKNSNILEDLKTLRLFARVVRRSPMYPLRVAAARQKLPSICAESAPPCERAVRTAHGRPLPRMAVSPQVPEYCPASPITAEDVTECAFDLIFAFDEIVALG